MNEKTMQFTTGQTIGVTAIAVMAGAIPALQPLLLGGLLQLGRITPGQLGLSATAEAIGMTISATLAATMLPPRHLRAIAASTLTAALLANLLTTLSSGLEVALARFLHGLCAGVMLWLLVGMLTRVKTPARLFAIYITGQASGSFVLSGLFTTLILPRFGAPGSYAALAVAELALILVTTQIPRAYAIIEGAAVGGIPDLRGLTGLGGVALYLAGILGFWVYVEPLLRSVGYHRTLVSTAITMAIGVQILAGLTASLLATRLPATLTCVVGAAASIFCIAVLLYPLPPALMFLAMGGFAFFWMLVPPFHVPFLIQIDPTHRSAMLVSGAQIGGSAIGPMLGAIIVPVAGYRIAGVLAMALFAGSAVLTVAAARAHRQPAPLAPGLAR